MCRLYYKLVFLFIKSCAGEYTGGIDTCQGDSGLIMIILNCLVKSVSLDFD